MPSAALTLLLLSFAGPASAQDADRQAQLTQVQGTVYLHLEGQAEDEFITAEEGAPLNPGDMVRTGTDGAAEVTMDGESVISLSADTDFIVDSLAPADTEFHLGVGQIFAKIKTLLAGQQMEFHTPTAVAAVRGTEFGLSHEDETGSGLGVFDEGHVAMRSQDGSEVMVGPNQETGVAQAGKPAPAGRLRTWAAQRQRMEFVRQRIAFQRAHWRPLGRAARRQFRARLMRRKRIKAANLARVRANRLKRRYAAFKNPRRGRKAKRRGR